MPMFYCLCWWEPFNCDLPDSLEKNTTLENSPCPLIVAAETSISYGTDPSIVRNHVTTCIYTINLPT